MASTEALPPCGIYRTTVPVGSIEANRLVFFHNHGEPGPGLYLPTAWDANRARFASKGETLPEPVEPTAATLEPLAREGFYRVVTPFFCCEKHCREFETDLLVQLGYNGAAEPILFVPELERLGVGLPTVGTAIDREKVRDLAPLKVAQRSALDATAEPDGVLH